MHERITVHIILLINLSYTHFRIDLQQILKLIILCLNPILCVE